MNDVISRAQVRKVKAGHYHYLIGNKVFVIRGYPKTWTYREYGTQAAGFAKSMRTAIALIASKYK